MLSISVKERKVSDSLDILKKGGFMPAVFYGKKTKSTPVSISLADFKKVFKEAGESTVVTLKTKDGDIDTLIHDVDFDPLTNTPRHVDFYVFDKNKKVEVDVPIEFVGEAPALKAGLLLVKAMHEIKLSTLPTSIPHAIVVDVSKLENDGDVVAVKDLPAISGVEFIDSLEETIVSVQTPKEEKEEEPIDLSAIEVEKKGKEVVEGEGEAPAEEMKE